MSDVSAPEVSAFADPEPKDRRDSVRAVWQMKVRLWPSPRRGSTGGTTMPPEETDFYWGLSDDISETGIFVATSEFCPEVGTLVELEFSLPDNRETVVVRGEVRWRRTDPSANTSSTGFGVEFIHLGRQIRERICRFVTRRTRSRADQQMTAAGVGHDR